MTAGPQNGRTDRAARWIAARPNRVWAAWTDPDAVANWLPPDGATGKLLTLDLRPGGTLHMILTFVDGAGGKTTADTDEVHATFVTLDPPHRLVLDTTFVSDDPANAGTMRMTWDFAAQDGGTAATITCENVPPGILAEAHATGLADTLNHLAHAAGDTGPAYKGTIR